MKNLHRPFEHPAKTPSPQIHSPRLSRAAFAVAALFAAAPVFGQYVTGIDTNTVGALPTSGTGPYGVPDPKGVYGNSSSTDGLTQDTSSPTNNVLNITPGASTSTTVTGNAYGAYTDDGKAVSGNTATLNAGTGTYNVTVSGNVTGGHAENGDATSHANSNTVNLNAGSGSGTVTVGGRVAGGYSDEGAATGNTVNLNGGTGTGSVVVTAGDVYGGFADAEANASNNTVNLDAGTGTVSITTGDVIGGYSDEGNATGNKVNLSSTSEVVDGNVYGGQSDEGNTTSNEVNMSDTSKVTGNVYGGYSDNGLGPDEHGDASKNTVNMTGGEVDGIVYGGYATKGNVTGNTVTLNGGAVTDTTFSDGHVYGGYSEEGSATGNTVNVLSTSSVAGNVYGGYAQMDGDGDASSNTVNIAGGTVGGDVFGGFAGMGGDGNANNNTVSLSANASITGDVYGGMAQTYGNATGNTVDVNDVTIAAGTTVYGGSTAYGSVKGNVVNLNSGSVVNSTNPVYGGYSGGYGEATTGNAVNISNGATVNTSVIGGFSGMGSADAIDNTVTLFEGATVTGDVIGGSIELMGNGDATGNIVTLSEGATVDGNVTGGSIGIAGTGNAVGNTVNLNGGTNVTGDVTGGTSSGSGEVFAGNTLNAQGSNTIGGDLANFATLNLNVSSTTAPVLDVVGTVSLDDGGSVNSTVNVGFAGNAALTTGSEVTLIQSGTPMGITLSPSFNTSVKALGGSTLEYDLILGVNGAGDELGATVNGIRANEQSKSVSEGYLSGTAFLTQGSDFLLNKGVTAARIAAGKATGTPEVFAALGYGKTRTQTGSSVAVKGYNLVTGIAFGKRLENASVTAAVFLEYGNGDYNSYNSFSTGKVKGRGDMGYTGLGVLARSDFNNGYHIEGSIRGGKVDADYRSDELVNNLGQRARYDTKTGYIGAHIGAGKRWELNTQDSIETYAQGIWTRQSGESTRLSTGERLKFDEVDSKRLRIGARYTHALTKTLKGYAGLAYEHEFGGEAKATTQGYRIKAPHLKGNTGVAEIGIIETPSASRPLFLDFGIQGYAGKREGVTGTLRVNYFF